MCNTYVYDSVYAILYNIYTVLHVGTLWHSVWNTVHCVSLSLQMPRAHDMQRSVDYFEHHDHIHRHFRALQHAAAHCNTLQHTVLSRYFEHYRHTPWHCSIMQHTSKHTATHCNTQCSVHNLDNMNMHTSTHPSDNLHLVLNDSLAIPFITRVYAIRTCVMQQSIFSTVDDVLTYFPQISFFLPDSQQQTMIPHVSSSPFPNTDMNLFRFDWCWNADLILIDVQPLLRLAAKHYLDNLPEPI